MKIWRLVAGILSIIMSVIVSLQSCAVGVVDAVEESDSTSSGSGILVAILMLAGGIVSICVRKGKGKGGSIALIVIFGLAALLGLTGAETYGDLSIWGGWCAINAVLALLSLIFGKKKTEAVEDKAE